MVVLYSEKLKAKLPSLASTRIILRDSGSDYSTSDSEFDYSNSELEKELEPIESSASKCLKVCMSGKNMFP
jgi:hypothetical protein